MLRQADQTLDAARQGVQAEGHLRRHDVRHWGASDQYRDLSLHRDARLRGAAQRPQLELPQMLSAVQVRRLQDRQGIRRLRLSSPHNSGAQLSTTGKGRKQGAGLYLKRDFT